MKIRKYLIFSLIALLGLNTACDILELEDENTYDLNTIQSVVPYAEGILLTAYRNIPVNHNYFNRSYASDDAVTNLSTSNIKTVVSGGWTSSSNPFSVWNTAYESIFYTNTFLEESSSKLS